MASQRSAKAPDVVTRTRRGTQFVSDASRSAVPLQDATNVSPVVPNSGRRLATTRMKRSPNSDERCAIMGRVISASISGRTHVGPGTKKFALLIKDASAHRGDWLRKRLHSASRAAGR